ncbi:hypothetical protein Tco_0470866 [Tanacetum coccineum]
MASTTTKFRCMRLLLSHSQSHAKPRTTLKDKAHPYSVSLHNGQQVENGIFELYFVSLKFQLLDMFTKALPEDRFKYLVRRIGMRCLTPAEHGGSDK